MSQGRCANSFSFLTQSLHNVSKNLNHISKYLSQKHPLTESISQFLLTLFKHLTSFQAIQIYLISRKQTKLFQIKSQRNILFHIAKGTRQDDLRMSKLHLHVPIYFHFVSISLCLFSELIVQQFSIQLIPS